MDEKGAKDKIMEEINVGDIFIRERPDGTKFLVLLLSSDREPGIEFGMDNFFRCAQFQMMPDNSLLGAQIVLYSIPELNKFSFYGKFEVN